MERFAVAMQVRRARAMASGSEAGQGATEYAVLAGLILMVVTVSGIAFADKIGDVFDWGIKNMETIQATTHTVTPG